MINERYRHDVNLLTEKRDLLNRISSVLLEKEVIAESEFAELLEGAGVSMPEAIKEPVAAAESVPLPGSTEKVLISPTPHD